MSLKHTAFALAALVAGAHGHAQVKLAVTADIGTTGAGLHVVVPMETRLNGRFGMNYFKHDFDKRSGLVDYHLDGKLQTFDLLFDWYLRPEGDFRLTGGIMYNGSRFNATGKPSVDGVFTFNGVQYGGSDIGTLEGDVTFRRAAPYLGIGWGNALNPNKRWNFSADLGAFYQGKATVNLIPFGCVTSATICAQLARDVALEEVRLAGEASDYKVYPVLRASVSYRF